MLLAKVAEVPTPARYPIAMDFAPDPVPPASWPIAIELLPELMFPVS
jgi:hypothetical protein